MTDRTKTICPPIFDLGGIKKDNYEILQIIVSMRYENLYENRKMTEFFVKLSFIIVQHSIN